MDSFISHYEIAVEANDVILKRFKCRRGRPLEEDTRFRRVFTIDQIEEARDLLRKHGFKQLPRQNFREPEVWMKEECEAEN